MFYKNYIFWLVIISLFCLILERLFPWRKEQKMIRPEILQDFFWLCFIGYFMYQPYVFGEVLRIMYAKMKFGFIYFFSNSPDSYKLIANLPWIVQFLLFFIVKDFIEWCVHNALHRVGALWYLHRVHHSITSMDWIGNFRMHWSEIFIYGIVKYLPLAVLGARSDVLLSIAAVSTLIGHLNHSNINISWGKFKYILNSPRMHIWHHEKEMRGKAGVNFGIVLSVWDWIFKTAYMPDDILQPEKIGFKGDEKVSHSLHMRFFLPFITNKKEVI